MKRRNAIRLAGATLAAVPLSKLPGFELFEHKTLELDDDILKQLERLKTEPVCRCEVRMERGGARLYLNGKEEYPLLAVSSSLLNTAPAYRKMGIRFLHPLIGMEDGWIGPGRYDWTRFDKYFAKLLELVPDAFILPRLHPYVPEWWKEANPDELIKCGLSVDPGQYKAAVQVIEGGFNWTALFDPYAASFASEVYKRDAIAMLRDFLKHMEASPLKSRMMGYQISGMHTGEWHYLGCRWMPDYSAPMQKLAGPIPSAERRIDKGGPLMRDPEKDRDVIEFLQKFHKNTAETVALFGKVIKEETARRVICGTFFCYVLENVMIQEAGHLVPEGVLTSPDFDYIATPYTYQRSNVPGNQR